MTTKNLVFDLGGVLINLDFRKTAAAFEALGVRDFDAYFTQTYANPLFKQLETGANPGEEFYNDLRAMAGITASDATIDAAWNAMLLDFWPDRIERLQELGKKYRVFLFSNTNAIHHRAFHARFAERFGFNFDQLFEKAWYSHLVGHRKPDLSAFHFILEDAGLQPAETIFIDDTRPNIDAADTAGMQTIFLPTGHSLVDALRDL